MKRAVDANTMMKCPKYNPETFLCNIQSMDRNIGSKVYKAKCADPEKYETCKRFLQFRLAARIGTAEKRLPRKVKIDGKTEETTALVRQHKHLDDVHPLPKAARIKKDGLAALDTFKKVE